jgi:hypothetical protein
LHVQIYDSAQQVYQVRTSKFKALLLLLLIA